jgi:hypothetical protein
MMCLCSLEAVGAINKVDEIVLFIL